MAHVTALAQHILTLEPDKDAARLCLYHYLKNLCEATEQVDSDLINRFYSRALVFNHWQQNKSSLIQETNAILQHYQDTHGIQLPLAGIAIDEIQVLQAENIRTLELVTQRHLEKHASPYDQIRILPLDGERVVAICLQADRGLRVTVFPRALAIREGELVPLTPEFTLFYSTELQLHPAMTHQIEVGPHAAARFRIGSDGIQGSFVRGYTFQKFGQMNGGGLHRYPVLFYPLKRLEQFFVNRKSDPMYTELTNLLEKALELISAGHPEAMKFAEAALDRGRLALEHIFPDDKLVRLLINNLEKTLALENTKRAMPANARGSMGDSAMDDLTANSRSAGDDGGLEGVFEIETGNPSEDSWPKIKNLPV
jgi:hypothetical protein